MINENKMMYTNKMMSLEDAKFMGDLFRCGTPPNMYYDATMLVLKEFNGHELDVIIVRSSTFNKIS